MARQEERRVEIIGHTPHFGNTLFYDDFEDVFKWVGSGYGAGYVFEKSQEKVFRGNYSLKLATTPTSPISSHYVYCYTKAFIDASMRAGVSLVFKSVYMTYMERLEIQVTLFTGTQKLMSWIKYLGAEKKWMYYDGDLGWVDMPNGDRELEEDTWHKVNLDLDFGLKKYGLAGCNMDIFPIKGKGLHVSASTTGANVYLMLYTRNYTTVQTLVYVDEFLARNHFLIGV